LGLRGEGILANEQSSGRDKALKSKDFNSETKSPGSGEMTRRETADYIVGMLQGLHILANKAELPFVAYLIAMALQEAQAERTREG
jgi:hypothetical protein